MRTRDPKKIRPPKRYEDELNSPSYQESSPLNNSSDDSRESSPLQELRYPSPERKKSILRKNGYHGPVIPFNPELLITSPAAFPTLDVPRPHQSSYRANADLNAIFDLDGLEDPVQDHEVAAAPDSATEERRIAVDLSSGNRGPHQRVNSRAMFMLPGSSDPEDTIPSYSRTITVDRSTRPSVVPSLYGDGVVPGMGPTDNGPRNAVWVANMKRIGELSRISTHDETLAAMDTSEEDEPPTTVACEAEGARQPKVPSWKDLTITYQLDLADTLYAQYPKGEVEQIAELLRLSASQAKDIWEHLWQRQEGKAGEETNQKLLHDHLHETLLNKRKVSRAEVEDMMARTIFQSVSEYDRLATSRSELAKAKAYFKYIGFDPLLLDGTFELSPAAVHTIETRSPVQPLSKTSSMRDVRRSLQDDSSAAEPSGRPLAQSTSARQDSKPGRPILSETQRDASGAFPHRRPTTAKLMNARSSPAAPDALPSGYFPAAPAPPRREKARVAIGQRPGSALPSRRQSIDEDYRPEKKRKGRKPSSMLLNPPEESTLPATKNVPAMGAQARPETNTEKTVIKQAIQPSRASQHRLAPTKEARGPINKKRASCGNANSNLSATGASSLIAVDKTCKQQSLTAAFSPAPIAPMGGYPWAASLGTTTPAAEIAKANDGNQK